MAKTYFGYKDRDVKNRFNWADVGVKVSQAIEKEAADREQRKADEAKAVRDIIKNARNKIPSSKNASLHNQIINTTNTQVQSLMSAYRDFKGGKGSQSQWVQRRQNMNDNIDNYLGLMTDFSTMYDLKIERQKNDDSLDWESKAMSQMQDFNDQTKWQVTNDEDDYAYMQRIGPDGEPLPGDENKVSLAIARKQIAMYYDKYDTQAGIKNAVDMFGVTKLAILKDGVFTREAIQGRKDWSDALQHAAQSELTNPFDRLSILEKDMRGKINYVFSKDEVGKTGINEDGTYNVYMKKDQITKILEPDFTTEQDDAIYTRFKDMVLTASDIKEVAMTPQTKSTSTWSAGKQKIYDQKSDDVTTLKFLDKLLTGTPADKESVKPWFESNEIYTKINWLPDGQFTTSDGTKTATVTRGADTDLNASFVGLAQKYGVKSKTINSYYNKHMKNKKIVLPGGEWSVERTADAKVKTEKGEIIEQRKSEYDTSPPGKLQLIKMNNLNEELGTYSVDSDDYNTKAEELEKAIAEYNENFDLYLENMEGVSLYGDEEFILHPSNASYVSNLKGNKKGKGKRTPISQ